MQNRIRRLLDDKVIEAVKQRERERMSQIGAKMAKLNAREEEKQRRNQEKMARLSQWNLKDGWGLLRVLQESGLPLNILTDTINTQRALKFHPYDPNQTSLSQQMRSEEHTSELQSR